MAYSLQKSMVAKVVSVSLVMLLAACSSDQRHKRQVSGDESYLDVPAQKVLNVPAGMILPVQNADYDIPPVTLKGGVGKQLDIRPPVQPLALLAGSRAQAGTDVGTLLLENSAQNRNLWAQVVRVLQDNNVTVANRQDAEQTLTTDWVQWTRSDEDLQYQGRYQISVQQQGYQLALTVKLLDLQQQGGTSVTDSNEVQRYTGAMLNRLSEGLDKLEGELENSRGAKVGEINVQSGSDDTGLPVLIVRSPYAVVWERLPAAMEKAGMTVSDRSRPQGSVSLSFKTLSSSGWDALGAKAPDLKNADYKIQVGDLDNRTSLQFTDAKGLPLTQSQNDALVAVFQAAFNQVGAK